MASNIRYNFDAIRALLTAEGTVRAVRDAAEKVENKAMDQGAQTRTDFQSGPNRARAAVIVGYEPGATAERSRRILLRSLDIGGD